MFSARKILIYEQILTRKFKKSSGTENLQSKKNEKNFRTTYI